MNELNGIKEYVNLRIESIPKESRKGLISRKIIDNRIEQYKNEIRTKDELLLQIKNLIDRYGILSTNAVILLFWCHGFSEEESKRITIDLIDQGTLLFREYLWQKFEGSEEWHFTKGVNHDESGRKIKTLCGIDIPARTTSLGRPDCPADIREKFCEGCKDKVTANELDKVYLSWEIAKTQYVDNFSDISIRII